MKPGKRHQRTLAQSSSQVSNAAAQQHAEASANYRVTGR
jgi:hypothetical protein